MIFDNPAYNLMFGVAALIALNHYVKEQERKKLLDKYKDRREHIVIITKPSNYKNKWFKIPPDTFNKFCIFVEEKDLQAEIQKQRKLLIESNNDFFENDELKKEHQLKILFYVFQDGGYAGEMWSDYESRTCADVQKHRIPFHAELKKADADDYYQHSKEVSYAKPKRTIKMPALIRAIASLF